MGENSVVVREFRPADAGAVSAVVRTTMRTSNRDDYPLERLQPLIDYFSPEKVAQLAVERHCLVAEVDGEIVGTISLDGMGEVCAELCTFFVLPDHQGTGIGSRLLDAIEDIAGDNGSSLMRIDSSKTGVAFYERRGYRRTGMDIEGVAGLQVGMEKRLNVQTSEHRVQM